MKNFFKLLLFNQNYNFTYFKNYSVRKNIFKVLTFKSKDKFLEPKIRVQNIHSKIINLREVVYKLISILYIPPGLVLYFFNFKFACANPSSIGTYSEEIEAILVDNIKNKKKLILLEPNSYSANQYFIDIIFKNFFVKITSNFFCIILTPFTYINFLRVDAYDKIDKIYFQRQYYYLDDKFKNKFKFDHDILFEKRYLSANKDAFNFKKLKETNKDILKEIYYKKVCFLHIRFEKKIELRNSEFKNYLETINYLIKNGFDVVFFSEFNPKLNMEGFHYFDLKIDENKKNKYTI